MKILILGAGGFVGHHLINYIKEEKEWNIAATILPTENKLDNVENFELDILDEHSVKNIIARVNPDYIVHLAAQSSVALSWQKPGMTVDINVKGTINVLEAAKKLENPSRILLVGSGEEYGHILPAETPIKENNNLRPGNVYAATKACQNMIGKIYADAYGIDIMMVRAFNHIGAGQSPIFVVSDFCKQVAEIEKGLHEPVICVGNLLVKRDFTDVRDVVKAYILLLEKGKKGEIYNVGSGQAVEIKAVLNIILSLAKTNISVEVDEKKFRPIDVPVIEADNTKLKQVTGWKQEISLDDTIEETLNYWREFLAN